MQTKSNQKVRNIAKQDSNCTKDNNKLVCPAVGKLKQSYDHWKAADTSEYILGIINQGYKISLENIQVWSKE